MDANPTPTPSELPTDPELVVPSERLRAFTDLVLVAERACERLLADVARLTAERDEARAFGTDVAEALAVAVGVLADERTTFVAAYGARANRDYVALLDRTAATLRDYLARREP